MENHEKKLTSYVSNLFKAYPFLKYHITTEDENEPDYLDIGVMVTNDTNDNKCYISLRSKNNCDGIQILHGEDFKPTNETDTMAQLFLNLFLTHVEI